MTRPANTAEKKNAPGRVHGWARAHSRRTLDSLRDLVEDSNLRHRDIETRAGWSRGYLSQVLGGHVELRLLHVEVLLKVLGVDPASFFRHLFPRLRRRRPKGLGKGPRLTVNREMLEVCGLGVESLHNLHLRIGRCERALMIVARQAGVQKRITGRD